MDIQHKIDGVGVMRLNKLLRILDSCLAREVMAVCVKRCLLDNMEGVDQSGRTDWSREHLRQTDRQT